MQLVLERVQLRPPRRPRIRRRRRRAQRSPNRLAMHTRATADLPDRQPLDESHPTDLGPLLHADHLHLLATVNDDRTSLRTQPDATRVGQISTGVGGPVFSRRRHLPVPPSTATSAPTT